jgi:hypothetical protein
MGDLFPRVAAVERLGPDQPGVVQRLPAYGPRPNRHALARDIVRDRQVGNRDDGPAGRAPDFHLAREVGEWHSKRERTENCLHQQEFLVGRKVGAGDECGRTEPRDLARLGIDPGKLAGREVLKEVFVVRVSEHVLERGHLAQVAGALLHVGTSRGPRRGGSRASTLGHEDSQDVAVI